MTWQPMHTAPRDGTTIIARERSDHESVFTCAWYPEDDDEGGGGDWLQYGTDVVYPGFWMPMPEEPETQDV